VEETEREAGFREDSERTHDFDAVAEGGLGDGNGALRAGEGIFRSTEPQIDATEAVEDRQQLVVLIAAQKRQHRQRLVEPHTGAVEIAEMIVRGGERGERPRRDGMRTEELAANREPKLKQANARVPPDGASVNAALASEAS